jgi:hypothetical protein
MKKWGALCGGSLRAMAVMAALLLVPLSAFAAGTHDHSPVASESSIAHEQDGGSPLHEPGCTSPESSQDLCCHFASPCPEAAGSLRSLNDDQPALAVDPVAALAVRSIGIRPTMHSATASITGPPRFILFGNFRS